MNAKSVKIKQRLLREEERNRPGVAATTLTGTWTRHYNVECNDSHYNDVMNRSDNDSASRRRTQSSARRCRDNWPTTE